MKPLSSSNAGWVKSKSKARRRVNHLMVLLNTLPNKPWNAALLSGNPSLEFSYVMAHPEKDWDWALLSNCPSLDFQYVLAHPALPWNWKWISHHPSLSLSLVLEHPELRWDWDSISRNRSITEQDVLEYPNLPWNDEILADRFSFLGRDKATARIPTDNEMEDLSDINAEERAAIQAFEGGVFPKTSEEWAELSINFFLSSCHVLEYPDHPWDWSMLSALMYPCL